MEPNFLRYCWIRVGSSRFWSISPFERTMAGTCRNLEISDLLNSRHSWGIAFRYRKEINGTSFVLVLLFRS
jgi:hypothetical protein